MGHNTIFEKNCSCVAGTVIYGSVKIGENVYIASATIKNQLKLGKNSMIGRGAVVTRNVSAEDIVVGIPAKSINK